MPAPCISQTCTVSIHKRNIIKCCTYKISNGIQLYNTPWFGCGLLTDDVEDLPNIFLKSSTHFNIIWTLCNYIIWTICNSQIKDTFTVFFFFFQKSCPEVIYNELVQTQYKKVTKMQIKQNTKLLRLTDISGLESSLKSFLASITAWYNLSECPSLATKQALGELQ